MHDKNHERELSAGHAALTGAWALVLLTKPTMTQSSHC